MTRKTQKKLRKLLTLVCCAVMLVCVTVGATVAYLTSTATVVNTFTVGNVQIKLDEADVDDSTPNADRDQANSYKVFPGGIYEKDPTVTVIKDSEEAYIFMEVKPTNLAGIKAAFPAEKYPEFYKGDLFLLEKLVDWNSTDWHSVAFEDDTYRFEYKSTVETLGDAQDTVLPALFTKISLPGTMTNTELAELHELQINVTAYAVQADGFSSSAAAWEATFGA